MMNEILNNTFGVEVEMYHISRPTAAQVVCNTLNRVAPVQGGWIVTDPTPHLNCRFITHAACAALDRWAIESDSSITDDRDRLGTAELVSPVLRWEQMEILQEVIRDLRRAGARSNAEHDCGVHVHIGADGHTATSLRNLVNLMASHEQLLVHAVGVAPQRLRWCKMVHPGFLRVINAQKPATVRDVSRIWYASHGETPGGHYNPTRYHMLNLHSFFEGKGLEFRLFQFDSPDPTRPLGRRKGGLHAGQLKAFVQLCLALNAYSLRARNCSPKVLESPNPRYTMRCWLLRLGFIGDEFATARQVLTQRLPGDCAFRDGRPSGAA